jgi:hypothetical protein
MVKYCNCFKSKFDNFHECVMFFVSLQKSHCEFILMIRLSHDAVRTQLQCINNTTKITAINLSNLVTIDIFIP